MPDGSHPTPWPAFRFSDDGLAPSPAAAPYGEPADDPVALQADARFAELAAEAATRDAIQKARTKTEPAVANPPELDAVARDWAARIDADERVIHAFLGIDDPIGREADDLFREAAIESRLDDLLESLPAVRSADGEMAALAAFDRALARGADAEEALSAAIRAAELVVDGGPPTNLVATDLGFRPQASEIDDSADVPEGFFFIPAPSEPPPQSSEPFTPVLGRDGDPRDSVLGPPPPPPPPPVTLAGLTGLGPGGQALADPAFGFGFQFAIDPIVEITPTQDQVTDDERNDPATTSATSNVTDVIGSTDADFLVGDSGSDAVGANSGDDFAYGDIPSNYQAGVHDAASPLTNPVFSASGGADVMSGGAGDDSLWGGPGADQIHGDVPDASSALFSEFSFPLGVNTSGNDYLSGGDGDDSLWGGGGADTLLGGAGDDRLSGDDGADTLYGGAGSDNLFGYAGDDILQGDGGDDTLAGGDGADEFRFGGAGGASALENAQTLGTDTISDYSSADNDGFGLSDADFGIGSSGTLTAGTDYFETTPVTLSATPQDLSSGVTGPAIVVVGSATGSDGVSVYYTDNAAQATSLNSYQIADILSVNASDVEAADFFLRS